MYVQLNPECHEIGVIEFNFVDIVSYVLIFSALGANKACFCS